MDNTPSKPAVQVRKPWCLLSRNCFGLGKQREGTAIFEKRPKQTLNLQAPKKNKIIVVYFFNFIIINSSSVYTEPIKTYGRTRLVLGKERAAAHARNLEGILAIYPISLFGC
jgi:hypothetical protein